MSGPWEKYTQPEAPAGDGPWAKYGGAAPEAASAEAARASLPGWLQRMIPPGAPVYTKADSEQYQRGAVRGLRDPIDAGAQLLTRGLESLPLVGGAFTGERQRVEDINRRAEQDYQAGRTGTGVDQGRLAGNVVGTLPVAGAFSPTVAGGAGAGAASGILQPVNMPPDPGIETLIRGEAPPDPGSFWLEKIKQAGIGGAAGAGGALVAKGIGRVLAPKPSEAVRELIDEGVTLTPGQRLGGVAKRAEEAVTSVPFAGDVVRSAQRRTMESFNRAAIDKALKPIGQRLEMKTPMGREAIDEAITKVTNAYDDLLPRMQFQADAQFLDDVANLRQLAQNLPRESAEQFDKVLKNQILSKINPNTGLASGEAFKRMESELAQKAANYRGSSVASERELGDAMTELTKLVRGTLQRTNPEHAAALARNNEAYAMLLRVQKASTAAGSKEGVFSPAAMRNAVKAMDRSLNKRQFARGDALMQDFAESAERVMGPTVPDSGTPFRVGTAYMLPALASSIEPISATAAGSALLPYTPMGQKATQSLLTSRPEAVQALGETVGRMAPYVGGGLSPALYSLLFGPSGP